MENKTIKQELRREVRSRVKQLTAEQKLNASREVFDRVERLEAFASARCIALYAALPDEVPTHEVIERWYASGRRIVLPRVEGEVMRYYDYTPSALQSGYCGIDEPMGDEEVTAAAIDMIIVPARAFTTTGVRMGRGGGFYDKYMSLEGFRACKVGVAFECQIFEELPADSHDIMVDEVIYA